MPMEYWNNIPSKDMKKRNTLMPMGLLLDMTPMSIMMPDNEQSGPAFLVTVNFENTMLQNMTRMETELCIPAMMRMGLCEATSITQKVIDRK